MLAASDLDADEERVPGEGGRPGTSGGGFQRRAGNMGSMSGADDALYMEYRRNIKHPLFKKFRIK